MKNILAENMLRFGVKNLSDKSKRKLTRQSGLDEQTKLNAKDGGLSATLTKISAEIPKFLDTAIASTEPNSTFADINKGVIAYYYKGKSNPGESTGTGKLELYKVFTAEGIPIIAPIGAVLNNQGAMWKTLTPTDYMTSDGAGIASAEIKGLQAQKPGEKLVTIWDTTNATIQSSDKDVNPNKQTLIKTKAIEIIAANPAPYTSAFQTYVTRTPSNLKQWLQPQTGIGQNGYTTQVVAPAVKGAWASKVFSLIQDVDLYKNIKYLSKPGSTLEGMPVKMLPSTAPKL